MKFASADPVTVPASFEFIELVVKRSVFVPVSNCGFASNIWIWYVETTC